MPVNVRRLAAMVAVVPAVAPWGALAVAAGAGLLLVGQADADQANALLRLRLCGVAVAVTAAGLLDDPAAVTLASSPVPLVARRAVRIGVVASAVASWWVVAAAVAGDAVGPGVAPALRREMLVLTSLAILGSLAGQRWSSDGRGGAGAYLAVGWFALSFLPRVGAIPLPPQPLNPASAGPLAVVAGCALAMVLLVSRDPAAVRPALWGRRNR